MCASVYSSLLLFTLTTVSIASCVIMATEGLPLMRQERGADRGILAGADFLSVFLSSSYERSYEETTTTHEETTTTPESTTFTLTTELVEPETTHVRATRSTSLVTSPIAQTEEQTSLYETTVSAQLQNNEQPSDSSLNDGVVVAIRVSSSVGRTLINKNQTDHEPIEDTTLRETVTTSTTTELPDQNFIASEEHPSLVAEANKSEFSVEESEPITTNSDVTADFLRGYPASVQPLPRPFSSSNSDKHQPIQQTVIYHNSPREPSRARSVSYSTVIQAVPPIEKHWDEEKHERQERHFDNSQTSLGNDFHNDAQKMKINETSSEDKNQFVTNTPNSTPKTQLSWENLDAEVSTRRNTFTTERNWEIQEKPYDPPRSPTLYGKPEQNYEVDESASVMTNGRIHGIQPSPTAPSNQEVKIGESKKIDDSQKVGYVVEGRNYRKYRVEERTPDGFIVGEYGVVSHNDGSLRGVRYTADGTINPRLIYDALMKFLSL